MKEKSRLDRARIQVGRISNFGLLEMTRQRLKESAIKWETNLSMESFSQKIIKKIELLAFSNKISFSLTFDNILNANYRNYLNRMRFYNDELGRNIMIQIKINH